MRFWIDLWTITFIVGLGIFAVLAVAVTIGGIGDIRSLFKSIAEQHESAADGDDSSTG